MFSYISKSKTNCLFHFISWIWSRIWQLNKWNESRTNRKQFEAIEKNYEHNQSVYRIYSLVKMNWNLPLLMNTDVQLLQSINHCSCFEQQQQKVVRSFVCLFKCFIDNITNHIQLWILSLSKTITENNKNEIYKLVLCKAKLGKKFKYNWISILNFGWNKNPNSFFCLVLAPLNYTKSNEQNVCPDTCSLLRRKKKQPTKPRKIKHNEMSIEINCRAIGRQIAITWFLLMYILLFGIYFFYHWRCCWCRLLSRIVYAVIVVFVQALACLSYKMRCNISLE